MREAPPGPSSPLWAINKAVCGPSRQSSDTPKWYEIKRKKLYIYLLTEKRNNKKVPQAGDRNKHQIRLRAPFFVVYGACGVRHEQACIIVFPSEWYYGARAVHDSLACRAVRQGDPSTKPTTLSCLIFFVGISRLEFLPSLSPVFFNNVHLHMYRFSYAYFRIVAWRYVNLNSRFYRF